MPTAAAESTPEFEQMQFDVEVAESAVAGASEAVDAAIRAAAGGSRRTDFLHDHVVALREARERVPEAIEKLGVARGSAKVAAYHGPSVQAQGPVIVAAIKSIAARERALLKLDTAAEKAIEAVHQRIDGLDEKDAAYTKGVAHLAELTDELDDRRQRAQLALETLRANADRAIAARNAGSLELAQDDARGLDLNRLAAGQREAAALCARLDALNADVSHESRAEHAQAFGRARGRSRKFDEELPQLLAMHKGILALKLEPLDLAKALKVLGLPVAQKTALAKALGQPPAQRAKALDALGAGASGKAMLETLARAKLI